MKWKKYHKKAFYSYTPGVFPTIELLQNRPDRVLEVFMSSNSQDSSGGRKI
jgi:TrmH family RNA methyltransferase